MKIDVNYLQKRGKAGWRYRRKIPKHLRAAFDNKLEIVIPLGRSEAEALRKYPKVDAEVERQLAAATKPQPTGRTGDPVTELERFQWAARHVRSLRLDPDWTGSESDTDPEAIARDVIADSILAKYPQQDIEAAPESADYGYPRNIGPKDAAILQLLAKGARAVQPEPTLEDARKLYLKEKVRDDKKKRQELDRVFVYINAALGRDQKISSLRREDAKEVRDYMLDGRSAATVDRYLNVVRATINHAINEYDLAGLRNPFIGLEVEAKDKAEPDRRKKRGYTDAELAKARGQVLGSARDDIRHIWRILEGTGCRLAEVTGLRTLDVKLDHAVPHIDVEWHDDRRVKTNVSRRKVPLLGDALEAAREALEAAGGSPFLFPAYCREGGPGSASAAISKHVRAVITDKKISPNHSLRHRMADLLDLAGVHNATRDLILGHSSGSIGRDYGSEAVRLEVAEKALRAAIGLEPKGGS
jgi:integrase